jgi:hypothetical protein
MEERGLPAARRARDSGELAALELKAHPAQGADDLALEGVIFHDILSANYGHKKSLYRAVITLNIFHPKSVRENAASITI